MESDGRRRLDPGAPGYPAALRRFREGWPGPVTAWGRLHLPEGATLGFFCSVRAPGDTVLKTCDLARALRSRSVTLVGGGAVPHGEGAPGAGAAGCGRSGGVPGARGWVSCGCLGRGGRRSTTAVCWCCRSSTKRYGVLPRRPRGGGNACVAALADRLLVAHAGPGRQAGAVVPRRPGGRQAGVHAGVAGQRRPGSAGAARRPHRPCTRPGRPPPPE